MLECIDLILAIIVFSSSVLDVVLENFSVLEEALNSLLLSLALFVKVLDFSGEVGKRRLCKLLVVHGFSFGSSEFLVFLDDGLVLSLLFLDILDHLAFLLDELVIQLA